MAYLKIGDPIPTKGKGSKLTGLQLRFIEEYMVDSIGTKAVIRAGYVTKNPNRVAAQLMQHPLVLDEIKKRQKDRGDKLELTANYVITRLIKLAEEATREGDQIRALELLGKTMALFKERQEISGPDGDAIRHEQKVNEDVADFTRAITKLSQRNRATGISAVPDERAEGQA